jgi:hypothetical protein
MSPPKWRHGQCRDDLASVVLDPEECRLHDRDVGEAGIGEQRVQPRAP